MRSCAQLLVLCIHLYKHIVCYSYAHIPHNRVAPPHSRPAPPAKIGQELLRNFLSHNVEPEKGIHINIDSLVTPAKIPYLHVFLWPVVEVG